MFCIFDWEAKAAMISYPFFEYQKSIFPSPLLDNLEIMTNCQLALSFFVCVFWCSRREENVLFFRQLICWWPSRCGRNLNSLPNTETKSPSPLWHRILFVRACSRAALLRYLGCYPICSQIMLLNVSLRLCWLNRVSWLCRGWSMFCRWFMRE